MKIEIYSKKGCDQCKALKNYLTNEGYEYIEKDVSSPENLQVLIELGIMSLPVMVVEDMQTLIGFDKKRVQSTLEMVEKAIANGVVEKAIANGEGK